MTQVTDCNGNKITAASLVIVNGSEIVRKVWSVEPELTKNGKILAHPIDMNYSRKNSYVNPANVRVVG